MAAGNSAISAVAHAVKAATGARLSRHAVSMRMT